MPKLSNPLILIIDDEQAILKTLKDALTDEDYRVETLSEGQKALDMIGKLVPDLILLDIFMPNCNGITLLTQIKKEYPDQKVIIISGFGNIPIAIEAVKKGAIDFIEKPLNLDEILNKISFLKNKNMQQNAKYDTDKNMLRECDIIGESNLFLELIQQTERLAPYNFPILICGEYGTGKTTLARYIHKKSALAQKFFKIINCETLHASRAETILQDVFTSDAPQTIYIKHVETLDVDEQKILLRVIENTQKNLRIIASNKTSLFQLTKKGLFNESLFYYLNKAPIEVPPLRKRPYDIPLLINHFLQMYNELLRKRVILTTQSTRLLRNHKWPGNITELQQAIQKIVACCSQDYEVVTPQKLTAILGEKTVQIIEEQALSQFSSLEEATIEFKKNFLLYLLQKNHYNIDQVSGRLNLSPLQLKNKLLELRIDIQGFQGYENEQF